MRDERRTWNMQNFELQQRSQIKHARRGNQPAIKAIIKNVHEMSRCKNVKRLAVEGGESLQQEKKQILKEEVTEKREKNLEDLKVNLHSSGIFTME